MRKAATPPQSDLLSPDAAAAALAANAPPPADQSGPADKPEGEGGEADPAPPRDDYAKRLLVIETSLAEVRELLTARTATKGENDAEVEALGARLRSALDGFDDMQASLASLNELSKVLTAPVEQLEAIAWEPSLDPRVGEVVLFKESMREFGGAPVSPAIVTQVVGPMSVNLQVLPNGNHEAYFRQAVAYCEDLAAAAPSIRAWGRA